jgi:hypothetical protein
MPPPLAAGAGVLGDAVAGDASGLGEEGFGGGGEEGVLDCGQHGAGGQVDAEAAGQAGGAGQGGRAEQRLGEQRGAVRGLEAARFPGDLRRQLRLAAEGGPDGDAGAVARVAARIALGRGGVGHGDGDR